MDYKISDLSPHLFWDVEISKLDWTSDISYIVEKTLMYGMLKDWKIINAVYGGGKIKDVSLNIRSMDDVTLSFLCAIYQLKEEDFRCYNYRQFHPNFWE